MLNNNEPLNNVLTYATERYKSEHFEISTITTNEVLKLEALQLTKFEENVKTVILIEWNMSLSEYWITISIHHNNKVVYQVQSESESYEHPVKLFFEMEWSLLL